MPSAKPKILSAERFRPRTRELATFKTLSCYPSEWDALAAYAAANQFKTPMDLIREMVHVQLPGSVAASFRQPKFARPETPAGSKDRSPSPRTPRQPPA